MHLSYDTFALTFTALAGKMYSQNASSLETFHCRMTFKGRVFWAVHGTFGTILLKQYNSTTMLFD